MRGFFPLPARVIPSYLAINEAADNNLVLVTKKPYRMLLKTISPYHKVTIQVKMMILMMIEVNKGLFLQKSL